MNIPWRKSGSAPSECRVVYAHTRLCEQLVGIVQGMTDDEVTYLTDLIVDASHRGHGLGADLMERFIEKVGGTTIVVLTQAPAFYARFGFQPVKSPTVAMIRRPTCE